MVENFHADVWAMEQAQLEPCAWEKWIDAAEKKIGHDLDGTLNIDGYSLDSAYDDFRAGMSVETHVEIVNERKAEIARAAQLMDV